MKVYHQTGFRYKWNMDAFDQNIGDGLIYSPVNVDADKLNGYDEKYKNPVF